jgi:hypothetical protein
MRRASLFVVVAIATLAALAPFARRSEAHSRCYQLKGRGGIRASVVTQGCTSPVQLCTAGVFEGESLLRGTTSFVADGIAPSAGLPATVEPPTTLGYSGLLTITTRRGTLTARDTGIFDTAAGLFSSRDIILGGTGIFAGATGHLFFSGTGTQSFESIATGEICLP